MPFMDHICELRNRVVKIALALVAGMTAGFIFFNQAWHVVERPLCSATIRGHSGCRTLGVNQLVLNGPLDAFYLRVKVALMACCRGRPDERGGGRVADMAGLRVPAWHSRLSIWRDWASDWRPVGGSAMVAASGHRWAGRLGFRRIRSTLQNAAFRLPGSWSRSGTLPGNAVAG